HASSLRFPHFQRAVAYWQHLADPDGIERTADTQRGGRRLHLSRSFDGMWFLDGRLDPISGAIVADVLRRVEKEVFDLDWADAQVATGEGACEKELGRTSAQRRADALVELATRAGGMPPGGRRPEPLFTVLVGYETFAGRVRELADGTVVTPGGLVA